MMPFGEIAAAAGKGVLKEAVRVGERAMKDMAVEAVGSGQKDAGWAGGTLAGSFASEIGTDLACGGHDIAGHRELEDIGEHSDLPSEIGADTQEADLPQELDVPSELDLPTEIQPNEIDAGLGEKTDAPEKKGGSYKEVKENSEGDTHEVHHMPADSASPLERNDGPAIKMEKEDHRQTASCGNSREAREYRAQQQELIEQGKFREALQMDIDDIRDKFGDKYDDAIAEMLEYVDKLEQEGKING